jgi:hypothetical protein
VGNYGVRREGAGKREGEKERRREGEERRRGEKERREGEERREAFTKEHPESQLHFHLLLNLTAPPKHLHARV